MNANSTPQLFAGGFSTDARGSFAKPFPVPESTGVEFDVKEIFSTVSNRGVIRGMHFQFEPDEIAKIVWVSNGQIFDVLVDLRDTDDFGRTYSYRLDATSGNCLFVPAGFAHGFQSLDDNSIVNYAVDDVFSPASDSGIRWDSIGIEWPLPVSVISDRDRKHPTLAEFAPRFSAV